MAPLRTTLSATTSVPGRESFIARVLVCLDHVASFIVNADHGRRTSPKDYAVWEIHPVMALQVDQ
jgi:hypothetical protein